MLDFVKDLSYLRKASKNKDEVGFNFKSLLSIYKLFGRHYKKYWTVLTVAFLSLLITIGLRLLVPWPLKLILDHLILKEPFPESFSFLEPMLVTTPRLLLLFLALSIIVIAFLEAVFSYIDKFWVSSTGERMNADVRERLFSLLQRLSLTFHQSTRTGNLIYLLTSDVKKIKDILLDFPQDALERILTFIGFSVMMLLLDWRLGLIALFAVPFFYLFSKYFGGGMKAAMTDTRSKEGSIASLISENINSMAIVHAYGQEETMSKQLSSVNKESLDAKLSGLRLQKTYGRINELMITLSLAGVLYWGGKYTIGSEILPGTLVLFVAYVREVYGSAENMGNMFGKIANSMVSGERMAEVAKNDMTVEDDPDAVPASEIDGKIEFDNVSFAYQKGDDVLQNLSFTIESGETVALVGHSGAGKSTLISMLLRFYDPSKGQIKVDGRNIRKITIQSLRNQITILLQDAKLFQQSVRDNIAFGKIGATEEEIINAAKLAEAHDFILQMPKGYDTIIQEGGANFSGGQKQRINIARAIIRDTPIVILDEPVTGLDAASEAKINAAIEHLSVNKTTFVIAHTFSTIKNADKILLLEGGKSAHLGTHHQLMKDNSSYRELYELQFGTKEIVAETGQFDKDQREKLETVS